MKISTRAGVMLLALVFVVAGCTTTTKADEADPSTSTASDTTTPAGTDEVDDSDESDEATLEELRALLPTADDVGGGYSLDATDDDGDAEDRDDDSSDDVFEEAMKRSCPGAENLFEEDSPDSESAEVSFSTPDDRQLGVELSPAGSSVDESRQELEDVLDAIANCEVIELEDDEVSGEMTLKVRPWDELGDFGAIVEFAVTMTPKEVPIDITIEADMLLFLQDDVGVFIFAAGSVDGETLEPIPPDTDIAERLATDLEERLQER